ncbi:MAG: hypothetical protein EA425_06135 [Puniceicoccaceae bacterium]|nr:MAG: hypothetical protein EA425_06135 [Puniceicoccaceae bacterium]
MTKENHPTLIHERVALARTGKNPTAVARLRSGWVVLGDDQRLKGYSLLLSDPVVDNLNALAEEERKRFLWEMSAIGDTLMAVLRPSIINYSILGNTDRALHAHIHPRSDEEAPEHRRTVPFVYHMHQLPAVPFAYDRDKALMDRIRTELSRRVELLA